MSIRLNYLDNCDYIDHFHECGYTNKLKSRELRKFSESNSFLITTLLLVYYEHCPKTM